MVSESGRMMKLYWGVILATILCFHGMMLGEAKPHTHPMEKKGLEGSTHANRAVNWARNISKIMFCNGNLQIAACFHNYT
jgi:hypothetical protein